MKKSISYLGAILITLFCNFTQAQSFGTFASAVWITDCNQSNFFNTSGTPVDLIGPAANTFEAANFGVHTQNSGTLIFRGAQVKTFKVPLVANVCSTQLFYRVYPQAAVPGAFNSISLPFLEDCNIVSSTFPSGGPCVAGDQKWERVISNGTTVPYSPVNLTNYTPGDYVLEVYYVVTGSFATTTGCTDLVTLNNSGNNYKAFFSIQSPILSNSTNPSTCNGSDGSITISGLVPNSSVQVSYSDGVIPVGPLAFIANGAGQITITGLNAGVYSNFVVTINGCTTSLNTGIILTNPIFSSTFVAIPPFCAGTTAPILPTTSSNGITGTWDPSVIDNQTTGNYTFSPATGTCGLSLTITVTVIPRTVPTFSFGTSLTICGSGTVPVLPNTSTNGFNGTWSPAVVDDQNSGVYTFTPNVGECATNTTFTVTVNPNITPTFSFGTTSTVCAGTAVPTLPGTSTNGITGTWSPAAVDNQNSGTYTFTPNAPQCATNTTFTVTVNPNVIPTFSFGTTSTICAGGTVPILPTTSTNGVDGTWNPAVVNNQNSGTYTFTPNSGLCATPTTFTLTVNPNITPTFSFGTASTVCASGTVPILPASSTNGITGTWNPATVDDQNSGVYTFTPDVGQCAINTTFTVTVNPNLTPTFSFGTTSSVCAGTSVPTLPATSTNGITGTWSPAAVDNQSSGVYTFTPNAGQCGTSTTFTVTVDPNLTATFSFGNSATICAGGIAPILPTTSMNGYDGTWSPSVVDNQVSGTYVFTGTSAPCIAPFTFTFTVDPIVTPTFSFGTFQSVCIGIPAPVLPNTSNNGITGTWSPAVVDNMASGTYTFTPTAGLCAVSTSLDYEVNPIIPSTSIRTDTTVYDGEILPAYNFVSTPGSIVRWTNSNSSIGLTDSGTGTVPSFTAINMTNAPVTATITATPFINGCSGTSQTYVITVLPLNKEIFVPNVFSPNNDGKNDILFIYSNYINTVEMHIFNQWGQKITTITDKAQGWDGRHKGTPQSVGVYVYVLKAVLTDGRAVKQTGSITLVR